MDAKPQRPMRALRISDENAPPQLPAGKTIHQRNKSTPALSTLIQVKGVNPPTTKRTVFADVSNTTKQPAIKDDMHIPGKGTKLDVLKDPAVVAVKGMSKSNALLRPAQRPLATKVSQANIAKPVASTLPKNVITDHGANEPNLRKVIAKKSTMIFKESNETALAVGELPPVRDVPEAASAHSFPPSKEERYQKEEEYESEAERNIQQAVEDISEYLAKADRYLDEAPPKKVSTVANVRQTQLLEEIEVKIAGGVETDVHAEAREQYEYLDALEEQARALEQDRNEELARQSHGAPVSDQEEYWDEEEEEEYFDADGYTTARSLRTRGDNTTGGITLVLEPRITARTRKELEAARQYVESHRTPEEEEDEQWDTSMVLEYGEEIFEYMRTLEERMKPNATYMDHQTEIQWSMRSVLIDWLVQVHHRFNLLPETLFLAVNYVDRFLSCKVVSLGKLQLVGATALFVAAKYEEINCPSVTEIVYMVDNAYTVDEILKAERFMLSMLQFELGWPGPMSFLRRISKADDYDLETRTLAKYFLEITIMDERFVGCAPSFTAAGAHCLARFMLKKGDWSQSHVHYAGYTMQQVRQLISVMLECCENPQKHHTAVYEKYADKRYKRASCFVEAEIAKGFQLPSMSRESFAGTTQSWRRK